MSQEFQKENEKTIKQFLSTQMTRNQLDDLIDLSDHKDVRLALANHVDELMDQKNFTKKMQTELTQKFNQVPKNERTEAERSVVRKLDNDLSQNLYFDKPETEINSAQEMADKRRKYEEKAKNFYLSAGKMIKKVSQNARKLPQKVVDSFRDKQMGVEAEQYKNEYLNQNPEIKKQADNVQKALNNHNRQVDNADKLSNEAKQVQNKDNRLSSRIKHTLYNSTKLNQTSAKFTYLAAASMIGLGKIAYRHGKSLVDKIKNHYERDKSEFMEERQNVYNDMRLKNALTTNPKQLAQNLNNDPEAVKLPGLFRPIQNHIDEISSLPISKAVVDQIQQANKSDHNPNYQVQRDYANQVLMEKQKEFVVSDTNDHVAMEHKQAVNNNDNNQDKNKVVNDENDNKHDKTRVVNESLTQNDKKFEEPKNINEEKDNKQDKTRVVKETLTQNDKKAEDTYHKNVMETEKPKTEKEIKQSEKPKLEHEKYQPDNANLDSLDNLVDNAPNEIDPDAFSAGLDELDELAKQDAQVMSK